MNIKPRISTIQGLLFTYCIENSRNTDREELIALTDVNNPKDIYELFDKLTKPEFIKYKHEEMQRHIHTIEYFLNSDEDFESVFYLFDTYFEDEILDKRAFMAVLLDRLKSYMSEAFPAKPIQDGPY
ncbi:hypothetical protein IFT48_32090 [Pseudomonas fluorescens]|uniref:hypothetical protein n=1 Tax=Pseudomonas fluorescens TaxID=294 RepID=UPI001904C0FA|nr:hypothetical protein [Pseudomonas fluorescens]MBD8094642.1 hypothetical protein [Pseudomonas fluorescens]MBD8721489.1 hypothetical protein [Pseudomonas fluorescens]